MALYSYGIYSYGLYSYGPYNFGLYSYSLYSDGLYSDGLYSYDLYEASSAARPQPDQAAEKKRSGKRTHAPSRGGEAGCLTGVSFFWVQPTEADIVMAKKK